MEFDGPQIIRCLLTRAFSGTGYLNLFRSWAKCSNSLRCVTDDPNRTAVPRTARAIGVQAVVNARKANVGAAHLSIDADDRWKKAGHRPWRSAQKKRNPLTFLVPESAR
jgi:hypothetical protein